MTMAKWEMDAARLANISTTPIEKPMTKWELDAARLAQPSAPSSKIIVAIVIIGFILWYVLIRK